jgi:P27 family predicted phage terminase small subunit
MRGPRTLKDPALLRGHRPQRGLVRLDRAPAVAPPRCPKDILPETRRFWRELWGSRVANAWDRESDLPAVTRYIRLLDRWLRYDGLVSQTPLVRGSKDQVRPNPLAPRMDAIEGQVSALEEQLGLTPAARLRLGISLVEALERDVRRSPWQEEAVGRPDHRYLLRPTGPDARRNDSTVDEVEEPDPRQFLRDSVMVVEQPATTEVMQ